MNFKHLTRSKALPLVLIIAVIVTAWQFHKKRSVKKPQNILLISIDTCRADFLSCYGYPAKTTPNIDALSRDGVLFENVVTPVPLTLPAHCSMLTGTIPPYHKVLSNTFFKLADDKITLAEILQENGFKTGAFTSSVVVDSKFGLAQGFEIYDDELDAGQSTAGFDERIGSTTTDRALKWLEDNQDKKTFAFIHYYDPHFEYDAPEPFTGLFSGMPNLENVKADFPQDLPGLYAGEIAFVDYCIGKVIKKLKRLGLYESTLICVTADHGEALGQHIETTHGYFIYQSALHVPLVMKVPGTAKNVRIKDTVGLVDIVPTVCSALGIELLHEIQGKDLMPYIKDPDSGAYPDRYIYCESTYPTKYKANPLLGVVTDRYKYIQTTRPELYDLLGDPLEMNNLFTEQPQRSRIMEDRLGQILEDSSAADTSSSKIEMDTETLKKLESLGYVDIEVEDEIYVIDKNKDDPKDMVTYHNKNSTIGFFELKGDFETAEANCQRMIEERPSLYIGYYQMAKMKATQKQYAESIDYLKKTIEVEPDYVYGYFDMAQAYKMLGEEDKAIEFCIKTLGKKPDFMEAYWKMAFLYYDKGMFDEAENRLTAELKESNQYADVSVVLAKRLIATGQIRRGFEKYRDALKLRPGNVDVLNSLAWLQSASDIKDIRNPQEALRLAKKACKLSDYNIPQALDSLAVAYAANDEFEEAVETAKKAIALARSEDKENMAGRIQKRLELYKNRQVYIDEALREKK